MIPLEDNVLVKAGKPSEPKSMRLDNTPYLDIAEANAAWPQESRHQRLFMHLVDGLYWYKDGTLDTDLVPFVESIDLTYETLLILQSASTVVSQVPVEVDTPTTVLLGPAVTTNKGIDLEASGELVCTIAGTYTFYITAHFGRTGNSGIATVVAYSEFFIGGVWTPNAYSTYTKLDSTASIFPYSRDLAVTLAVGDRVRFRFLVNSGGATTAGLYNFDPTAPGVPTAETARIAVSKFAVNINGSALPIILDGVPEPTSGGNFLRTIGNWIEGVTKSLFDSTVTNIEAAIDLKATDITAGDGSKRYVRKNTTPQTWEELTTIPEPTSDGSWLRSKASTVYTWVLSVVFTQTEKDKLAKYPTAATNGKMLMGDGNNYVEVDAPSGGGIPEPTADGSWLRSKASAVYSWVLSVIFTQVEKDKLAKYPTEATVGKVLVGNGTVYGEADVTVTNNTTVNITNTSGEYPIWYGFIKGLVETFTSTVTTSSWVWNGGVATNDTANGRLAITSVNNAKGAKIPFLHTAGMLVKLKLDITVPTGVVDVRDQYSNFIAKDLVTGIYYLEFTAQTTNPASFGRNVLLSSTTNSDFYINHVEIGYVDQANFVFTESEISRVNHKQFKAFENYLYQEDFRTKNTSNIGIYGTGTLNIDTILRTATVTFTSVGGNVFYIGYNSVTPIVIPTYSIITLEIVSLVNPILVQPNWGNGISETISTPGIYTFKFKKLVTNAIPQLNGYCLSSVSGLTNTIVLKNIKIENSYPDSLSASPTFQEAGYGASNLSKTGSIIGINTKGNMDTPLMLGNNSRGYFDNAFGGTTGPETTTIGNDALAASWRGTVLGAKSYNYAISATALGATTFVTRTHDVVLGRGAYGALKTNPANPNDSSVTTDPRHLYMGNGTAHMRNTPPSGIGCKGVDGSPITPSNTENIIHGQNAYDDRFPLWSSLTNYLAVSGWTYGGNTSWVRRVDTIYVAIANNINVDPLTDVPSTPDSNGFYIGTAWKKIYSVPPGETSQGQVAGDGTVAGGHIGLEAGTGTGGQHGGEVRFYTHKANAEGSNVPTTRKLIAKFISNNASNNTSFMLLDTTTNTWYSVNIGNTGTGPGGVGRALYVL